MVGAPGGGPGKASEPQSFGISEVVKGPAHTQTHAHCRRDAGCSGRTLKPDFLHFGTRKALAQGQGSSRPPRGHELWAQASACLWEFRRRASMFVYEF